MGRISFANPVLSEAVTQISIAFRQLLTEKHLYQSVVVDTAFIAKLAANEDSSQSARKRLEELYEKKILTHWALSSAPSQAAQWDNALVILPPQIMTFCSGCGDTWPFRSNDDAAVVSDNGYADQTFLFFYECQRCIAKTVSFLVRRQKFKLTLCGRDPIESVAVPKTIPKSVSEFFSQATIAYNAGQTLAGIFFLRVFVEQHWRSVLPDKVKLKRVSGDELGEAYKETLADDFKSRHPTLTDTYANLSAAIHAANADVQVFMQAKAEIEKHFEALPHFR